MPIFHMPKLPKTAPISHSQATETNSVSKCMQSFENNMSMLVKQIENKIDSFNNDVATMEQDLFTLFKKEIKSMQVKINTNSNKIDYILETLKLKWIESRRCSRSRDDENRFVYGRYRHPTRRSPFNSHQHPHAVHDDEGIYESADLERDPNARPETPDSERAELNSRILDSTLLFEHLRVIDSLIRGVDLPAIIAFSCFVILISSFDYSSGSDLSLDSAESFTETTELTFDCFSSCFVSVKSLHHCKPS
uniref:Uncharacterized protein n=1 Tax=Trichogramma kaykai TaxID=54128 RepID=A0ABD2VXS1_9HYME